MQEQLSLPINKKHPELSNRKWDSFYQDNAIPDIHLQTRRNRYTLDVMSFYTYPRQLILQLQIDNYSCRTLIVWKTKNQHLYQF